MSKKSDKIIGKILKIYLTIIYILSFVGLPLASLALLIIAILQGTTTEIVCGVLIFLICLPLLILFIRDLIVGRQNKKKQSEAGFKENEDGWANLL